MNKAIINDEVVIAYDVLKDSEIVENGKIKKTWRGQISTFGAAVTMGSLIPAVAFFSDQGGSSVKRQYIMDAILEILKRNHIAPEKYHTLFEYVREQEQEADREGCEYHECNKPGRKPRSGPK